MQNYQLLTCLNLLLLVGCSGVDSGTMSNQDQSPRSAAPLTAFQVLDLTGRGLAEDLLSNPITMADRLPISGTSSYEGVIGFSMVLESGEYQIWGELGLVADFDSSTIMGEANGFVTEDSEVLEGNIDISEALIDRQADQNSSFTFYADASGVITFPVDGGVTVDAVVAGDFYSEARGVVGIAQGDFIASAQSGDITNGLFLAEQE